MFSFLTRKQKPSPPTFNERVTAFWNWFEAVAPRFYQTIEDKKCGELTGETSAKIDELLPGFAWVYGPGENGIGHSFTLSGEGDMHRQLLALHWLGRAPKVKGWSFYASRQPGPIKGHTIKMYGQRFDPAEIWVTPISDTENKQIDITIWHHAWVQLTDNERWTVLFIFLDESLGEYGTGHWIGKIKFSNDKLADSFPLEELADYIARTASKNDWKKYPPGEAYTGFEVKPAKRDFPRGDVFYQTTNAPALFCDYMDAEGQLADPLKNFGADYLYIAIERSYLPEGKEVDARAEIEDALEAALKAENSGRTLGGASGTDFAYIDLLVYDGFRSVEIIKQKVQQLNLPSGTMIEYFAREKRSQRIAL